MKSILLINPPPSYLDYSRPISPPLGITSIASVIKEYDYEVKLIDGYLIAHQKENLEQSLNEIITRIKDIQPDLVGVSLYSGSNKEGLKILKSAKKIGSITVAGGVDATLYDQEYITSARYIDYLIRGEGEYAFLSLIQNLNKNLNEVPNLTYYYNGVCRNKSSEFANLDQLPFPARDLLDNHLYMGGRSMTIEESRGCYFNCSFCAIKQFNPKIRLKSEYRIRDEIENCINLIKPKSIRFVSENVLLNQQRGIKLRNIMDEYKVPWMINSHPIQILANKDLLEKMVISGLNTVELGIESGSENILSVFNKKTSPKINNDALNFLEKIKIPEIRIEYIMFNPLMSYNDLIENINFIEFHKDLFFKDPKFPKHLFTELFIEEKVPFFNSLINANILEEIVETDYPKKIFKGKYRDKRVETVLNHSKSLKLEWEQSDKSLFEKEKILESFKKFCYKLK